VVVFVWTAASDVVPPVGQAPIMMIEKRDVPRPDSSQTGRYRPVHANHPHPLIPPPSSGKTRLIVARQVSSLPNPMDPANREPCSGGITLMGILPASVLKWHVATQGTPL
jgi:hypothetical protein